MANGGKEYPCGVGGDWPESITVEEGEPCDVGHPWEYRRFYVYRNRHPVALVTTDMTGRRAGHTFRWRHSDTWDHVVRDMTFGDAVAALASGEE